MCYVNHMDILKCIFEKLLKRVRNKRAPRIVGLKFSLRSLTFSFVFDVLLTSAIHNCGTHGLLIMLAGWSIFCSLLSANAVNCCFKMILYTSGKIQKKWDIISVLTTLPSPSIPADFSFLFMIGLEVWLTM